MIHGEKQLAVCRGAHLDVFHVCGFYLGGARGDDFSMSLGPRGHWMSISPASQRRPTKFRPGLPGLRLVRSPHRRFVPAVQLSRRLPIANRRGPRCRSIWPKPRVLFEWRRGTATARRACGSHAAVEDFFYSSLEAGVVDAAAASSRGSVLAGHRRFVQIIDRRPASKAVRGLSRRTLWPEAFHLRPRHRFRAHRGAC